MICPLIAFREDLSTFIAQTLSEVFEIILSIDANENMRDSKLQRAFHQLGLVETSGLFSDNSPPASHITGSK